MAGEDPIAIPLQVLVCESDQRRVALPFASLVEVVQVVNMTSLPGAPAIVEGVINVRGTIVPVVELGVRLGLPSRPVKLSDHLVLARTREHLVALRVDRAADLLELDQRQIAASHDLRGAAPSIAGAVGLTDGIILVCDLDEFLEEEERASLAEALFAQPELGAP